VHEENIEAVIEPETVQGYHLPRYVDTIHRQFVRQLLLDTDPCVHLLFEAIDMLQSTISTFTLHHKVLQKNKS